MSEQSMFWSTNGTGDGISGGYTQQRVYDFFRKMFTDQWDGYQYGVLRGTGNEFSGPNGFGPFTSPVTVQDGAAMVYGFFYENTAATTITIPTPAATTGGRIVIEANWSAQTVRLKQYQSASGVTTPPALQQTPGSVYQMPLYSYTIQANGQITFSDERQYLSFSGIVTSNSMGQDAINVNNMGNGMFGATYRFGGDANDYTVGGTTQYQIGQDSATPGSQGQHLRIAMGTYVFNYPGDTTSRNMQVLNVGYGTPFSAPPMIFTQVFSTGGGLPTAIGTVEDVTASTFTLGIYSTDNQAFQWPVRVFWMAIGH